MAMLTATELASLRRKVGDQAETTWTDSELNAIYTEAAGNFNEAIAICYEELMGNAAKFADYTQNESSEKKSQIFNNLAKLAGYYRGLSVSSGNQVRVVGLKQRPPRRKQNPSSNLTSKPSDWWD